MYTEIIALLLPWMYLSPIIKVFNFLVNFCLLFYLVKLLLSWFAFNKFKYLIVCPLYFITYQNYLIIKW